MPISIAGSGAVTGASTLNGLSVPTDALAPALVLVNNITFSTSSAVSINNCFTSTYSNYKVMIETTTTASSPDIRFRMRAGGIDDSSSTYDGSYMYGVTSSVWASPGTTFGLLAITDSNASWPRVSVSMELFSPQINQPTTGNFISSVSKSGVGINMLMTGGFAIRSGTTRYDGITIYPSASSISGTVKIYGYRD